MWIVTGGNGFIGSQMVRELNQRGQSDIIVVDPVSAQERPEPLRGAQLTRFLHRDELWKFLETPNAIDEVEWVIHMGANSSTTETNWEHLQEVNTRYTQRLFEWCAQHTKPLIYASSAATYGAGEMGYDDEMNSEKLKPLNLYGESKVLFDRWAVQQEKMPSNWYGLKFFNVYGPGEAHKGAMSSVVYKAYHQIKDKSDFQLFKSHKPDFKNGEQMRDFIYVKEVTAWIWELTMTRPASGVYNMGTGRARTWLDLVRSTFKAMGKEENIHFIEMPDSLRDQYQYFTEARMLKWARAGMSPSHWPLEDGVKDYVQNHLMKG